MAGLVHQGPHPQPWDQETNPVPIIGKGTSWEFTPEQSWQYLHPEPPQGYDNWTDYVVDVYDAQRRGQDLPYDADQSAAGWLQHSIGYGKLAPLVDTSNPKVSAFLDSLYTNSTGKDESSMFGEMFFPALAALGIVGGATALAGLGAGAAGAGAGAAEAAGTGALGGATGLGTAAGEVAGAGVLGGTTGLGGLAGATAPAIATGTAGAAGAAGTGVGGLLSALGIAAPTTPLGWASLVGSGISGLGSLVGGIQGASAAKSAANTQAQSAQNANKLLSDIYTQQRSDLTPYTTLGTASLGDLMRRIQTNQQTPVQSFNLANYRR